MEKLKTKLKNWKKSIEYYWNSLPVKTQRNYIAVLFMLYVLMTLAALGSGEKLEERVKKLNVSNHGNK